MKTRYKGLKVFLACALICFLSIGTFSLIKYLSIVNNDRSVVHAAARDIKLNYYSLTLGKGEKIQLIANQGVGWRSSNPKIAAVNSSGQITASGEGTAWITATADGCSKTCRVNVKKQPGSVSLNLKELTLGMGECYSLSAVLPEDTAAAVRTFRSSNSSVIRMTKTNWSAEFTAAGKGTAWVTVKLYNGKEASCKITVKDEPSFANLNYSELTLGKGEKYKLNTVLTSNTGSAHRTYDSSNSSIVEMTKSTWNAEFVARNTGSAVISVKLYNGVTAKCRITVKNAPQSVSLNKSLIYLKKGDKDSLSAFVPAGTAATVRTFRSSNSSIIKMTKTNWKGEFTAVGNGTAWVTVRLYNGVEKSCKIIVTDKPVVQNINGVTYIDGVLIVNKTYSLPRNYGSGLDSTALSAFNKMASDASYDGIYLTIVSGFRSYYTQAYLYDSYVSSRGQAAADTFSARPGHSEHQTGLAMDVNSVYDSFRYTAEAKWLKNNCWRYGFIIRYPEGKEHITGYKYESWHIRYVGKELAKILFDRYLTLEEYFGISSVYS